MFIKYSKEWVLSLSGILTIPVLSFLLYACSSTETAGNSAEIGNPEIAGVVSYPNGEPASRVSVRCVPEWFSAGEDSLPESWVTETDSLGHYRIDSLPDSHFAIEASHENYSLLKRNLSVEDSSYSGKLSEVGALRLSAGKFKNGDSVLVRIPGSTFLRYAHVENDELFLDSLPATLLDAIVVEEDSLVFDSPVEILPGKIIKENVKPLSFTVSYPLNGQEFSSYQKFLPLALRLNKNQVNWKLLESLTGRWEACLKSGATQNLSYVQNESSEEAVFWVLLDSLPAVPTDTILLTFTEGESRTYDNVFSPERYIAVWHFDEGTSTAEDATGNKLHGLPEKVVESKGVLGKSFYYDGSHSYVTIPNSAKSDLDFAYSDSMSISVWVNIDSLNTSRFVYGKGTTQYHLKYYYPNNWLFERYREKSSEESVRYWYYSEDTLSSYNEWSMITVTQQDSLISLYVNGDLVTSESTCGTFEKPYYSESDFEIGRLVYELDSKDSVGQHFLGSIDELHVMRQAISADRAKVLYLNQKPVDYWPKALFKE